MLGDRRLALLVALVAFLGYNANFRVIGAGDTLPARFIPFAHGGPGRRSDRRQPPAGCAARPRLCRLGAVLGEAPGGPVRPRGRRPRGVDPGLQPPHFRESRGRLRSRGGGQRVLLHESAAGRVAGLLVSPGRGLLVFTPFLLFLPLLYLRTLRDRPHHLLTLFLTGGVLLQILLYAPSDWRAGFSYGPRFLTDALPILVWMIAPVLASLERKGRIAFLAAGLFSVYVQVVGAFLYIGTSDLILYRVKTGPGCMMAAWEPRNAPFLLEMENGLASRSLWWVIYGSLAD